MPGAIASFATIAHGKASPAPAETTAAASADKLTPTGRSKATSNPGPDELQRLHRQLDESASHTHNRTQAACIS